MGDDPRRVRQDQNHKNRKHNNNLGNSTNNTSHHTRTKEGPMNSERDDHQENSKHHYLATHEYKLHCPEVLSRVDKTLEKYSIHPQVLYEYWIQTAWKPFMEEKSRKKQHTDHHYINQHHYWQKWMIYNGQKLPSQQPTQPQWTYPTPPPVQQRPTSAQLPHQRHQPKRQWIKQNINADNRRRKKKQTETTNNSNNHHSMTTAGTQQYRNQAQPPTTIQPPEQHTPEATQHQDGSS